MKEIQLSEIRNNSQEAWEELFTTHHRLFVAIVTRLGIPESEVEDVIQDAFLNAHKGIKTLRPGDNPIPWIGTIVKHAGIDYLRKNKRKIPALSLDSFKGSDGEEHDGQNILEDRGTRMEDTVENMDVAERALSPLQPKDRKLLVMKAEGYSLREMSHSFYGVDEKSVKTRIFRARAKASTMYAQ